VLNFHKIEGLSLLKQNLHDDDRTWQVSTSFNKS